MSVEFQDYDQTRKKFEVVKDLIKPGKYTDTIVSGSIQLPPEEPDLTGCL